MKSVALSEGRRVAVAHGTDEVEIWEREPTIVGTVDGAHTTSSSLV